VVVQVRLVHQVAQVAQVLQEVQVLQVLRAHQLEKARLMKDRQTERSITRSHIVKADYLNGASDEQLTTREFIRIF